MRTNLSLRSKRSFLQATDGGSRRTPWLEPLENRQLLSASLSAVGLLTVTGTTGPDAVVVNLVAGKVQVKQGGVAIGNYTPSAVKSIVINGLAGNDSLQVMDAVVAPATVNGGDGDDFLRGGGGKDILNGGNHNDVLDGGLNADVFNGGLGTDTADYAARTTAVTVSLDGVANDGNAAIAEKDNVMGDVENVRGGSGGDTLTGNASANVLVGNSGNDTLRGGGGLDVLIGGIGLDTLYGDAGGDLLIGSRTTYDTNIPALRTLGYEWRNPANSYATKITRLKAGTPGVKLDKTTVPTDLATDTLTGGAETDWFITHWGDLLKDKASTETATLISSPIRYLSQVRQVNTSAGPGESPYPLPRSKSASNFAVFNQTLASSFVDNAEVESAFGNASQNSSLTDTKLSFAGVTSASSFDSNGYGGSSFLVTFVLDEPRQYTLTYTYSRDGSDNLAGVIVRLSRGATSIVDFADEQGTNTNTTVTKTGSLQAGQYTLELWATSAANGFANTSAKMTASLTTVPTA